MDLVKLEKRTKLVLDKIESKVKRRDLQAQVVFALDYSGSMENEYLSRNGQPSKVQRYMERILATGIAIDPDKQVDVILFHHGVMKVDTPLTLENCDGYVANHVHLHTRKMGSTKYAPIINHVVEKYKAKEETVGGLFGFGGKKVPGKMKYPVYVIFLTDGENDADEKQRGDAEKAITEAAKHKIFFQFVGIGREQFKFLTKLDDLSGRFVDNADFFKVDNIVETPDEQLYDKLFNEFPGWLTWWENQES